MAETSSVPVPPSTSPKSRTYSDALALDTLEPPPDDSPASDQGVAPQASLSPEADE